MNSDPVASVAREPVGSRLAWKVLAGEHALRHRLVDELADAFTLAQRYDVFLDAPAQHVVLRLVRHDPVEAESIGDRERLLDLLRAPLGHPDVQDLALADEIVERAQGFLERRVRVVPVRLVEVEVVRAQSPERGVRGLHHVLAGQPALVRADPGRPVDLGQHLDRLPPYSRPGRARALPRPASRRTRRRCRRW